MIILLFDYNSIYVELNSSQVSRSTSLGKNIPTPKFRSATFKCPPPPPIYRAGSFGTRCEGYWIQRNNWELRTSWSSIRTPCPTLHTHPQTLPTLLTTPPLQQPNLSFYTPPPQVRNRREVTYQEHTVGLTNGNYKLLKWLYRLFNTLSKLGQVIQAKTGKMISLDFFLGTKISDEKWHQTLI